MRPGMRGPANRLPGNGLMRPGMRGPANRFLANGLMRLEMLGLVSCSLLNGLACIVLAAGFCIVGVGSARRASAVAGSAG
jgi:hypothetical protein